MPTDTIEAPSINGLGVVKFNITDSEIAKMKEEYLALTVNGLEDKTGLKRVYDARQIVKKTRVGIVKYANELKESALAWQRKVNSEKDRVVGELEAIEEHLQAEEDKIQAEKDHIAAEKEKQEQARLQERIDKLAKYGYGVDLILLKAATDAQFEATLENARIEFEKAEAIKIEEARLKKLEEEKLIAERKELEQLRVKQAEAQRIIDENNAKIRLEQEQKEAAIRAEQEKIEAEKREIELQRKREEELKQHEIELQKARDEAAEKERLRLIEVEKQKKIDEEEKLALASDKVKFQSVYQQLSAITIPQMKSARSKKVAEQVNAFIENAEQIIATTFNIK